VWNRQKICHKVIKKHKEKDRGKKSKLSEAMHYHRKNALERGDNSKHYWSAEWKKATTEANHSRRAIRWALVVTICRRDSERRVIENNREQMTRLFSVRKRRRRRSYDSSASGIVMSAAGAAARRRWKSTDAAAAAAAAYRTKWLRRANDTIR